MSADGWIAATQALIAFSLLLLTLVVHRKEEGWKKGEVERTRAFHSDEVRIQRLLKVHEWGHECISTLSTADNLCLFAASEFTQGDLAIRRADLLQRLSALTDQGRMFFENKEAGDFGSQKLPAYRGLRPRILDPLVATYLAIKSLDVVNGLPDESRRERLIGWRRYFVSLLQKELREGWTLEAARYSEFHGGGAGAGIDENSTAPTGI